MDGEVKKKLCMGCRCYRPLSEFGVHESGELYVSCNRCLQRRKALREREKEREVIGGVKKCLGCQNYLPLSAFTGSQPGRMYASCVKCREKSRARYEAKGARQSTCLELLSRAVCLVCTLPAEVCRGQLNAGCLIQCALEAQKGLGDGEDRKLVVPDLVCTRSEAEPLAVLPPGGFEVAGVARARGNDRSGEVWMRLK